MLWNKINKYEIMAFESEADFENAVNEVKEALFGPTRIYLDDKKKIGEKGKTNNLPDGYLVDLSNNREPSIFVVENELYSHQHLKHIAVQILEFSLSFDSDKLKVKNLIKDMLSKRPDEWAKCENFAKMNNYGNVDYLLESIIHKQNSFKPLLIIDDLDEELENLLVSKFRFPVDIITLRRYRNEKDEMIYEFDPFMNGISSLSDEKINISDIDTIVVPAREDGFKEVFLNENRWYAIRLNSLMIPRIKYIAVYQVAPISAITHIAEVKSIEHWNDTNKYVINFTERARKIKDVPLGDSKRKAPQSPRYSTRELIENSANLDSVL